MNYLAHLYLSGENEEILVGNFIGDYVKGKKHETFPDFIQKGIILHRQIDSFTDSHTIFREAKKYVRQDYGLYSGVVIDLFYDHLLAVNWNQFSDLTLRSFSKRTHAILLTHFFQLPKKVQGFLPFLIQHKRLESYGTIKGIQKSLEIMSKYSTLPDKSIIAAEVLRTNFNVLESGFLIFMNEIIEFIQKEQNITVKKPATQAL